MTQFIRAVIDIGTNTTRVLVRDANQPDIDLLREVRVTGLGRELERTGMLSKVPMNDTRAAVIEFVDKAQDLGASKVDITIYATAASRVAKNGAEFIENLEKETGCTTHIIDGQTEGRSAFAGAMSGIAMPHVPAVVFDIGGGSTEFVISSASDAHEVSSVVSIPIGSVRITERHLESDPPAPEELTNAIADIRDYLTEVETHIPGIKNAKTWIGVAATVTTTAAIEQGLHEFDARKIHEFVLTKEMAEDVFRTLATESLADRIHNPGLEKERADVIVGGVAIVVSIMRHFELASIVVSCTDLLDGLWLSRPS